MPSGTETVIVKRTAKVDRLSSPPAGEPETFDLENCQILPRQTFEEGRGWITVDGWDVWCFTDPGREVLSTDQVEIRGTTYDIEGTPGRFDKRGTFKALKVVATRVGAA